MTTDIKLKTSAHTSATPNQSEPRAPGATLAEEQLRMALVRVTGARIKVLTVLLEARCAVSHQDMQDLFVEMDRVTLYRALDCLTDAGLAHKIAGDDRVFLYSAGAEHTESISADPTLHAQHQHGHFKCTRCTKVFCLDGSGEAGFLGDVLAPVKSTQAGKETTTASPAMLRQHLQQALQDSLGKGFE
ncbi:MAG: transcriptional repressor, partial [Glaciimonas sp.]|nr:transcriptional repressor [Glaciimonas sp.]